MSVDGLTLDLASLGSPLPLLVRRGGRVTVITNRDVVIEPETTTLLRGDDAVQRRVRRRPGARAGRALTH